MGNQSNPSFSSDEIRKLKYILKTLRTFVRKNQSLVRKLGLENKFAETIGEGKGLLLCYERFGNSVSYEWPGRRKRRYDLRLKSEKGSVEIQVKTNTDESYDFKFSKIKVDNKVKKQLEKGDTEPLFRQLKSEYERKYAEFFLLIHWPKLSEGPTCYILNKERLIKALREDYQVNFDKKKHTKKYNYGISKAGEWWPHLNQRTVDSLTQFKEKWDPIDKELGLRRNAQHRLQ